MKNNKGVTLIALAITIIVMLILASITIGSIRDKKGIVKQAETSSAEAEKESIIEKIEADLYNEKIKKGKKPTKSELKQMIEAKGYSDTLAEDSFTSKGGKYTINYDEILGWEGYVEDGLILHLDAINNTGEGDSNHSNTSNIWKDLSGNGNDATLTNINQNDAESGWKNNCLQLDGIDDYAVIADSSTMKPTDQTIEIVFNRTGAGTNADYVAGGNRKGRSIIFVRWYGYTVELNNINSNNQFNISYGRRQGEYLTSKRNATLNRKYQVTMTTENNITKMYLDSAYDSQKEQIPSTYSDMNKTNIGMWDGTKSYTKGNIYSIRMYNRALTQEEIENNYRVDQARFGI